MCHLSVNLCRLQASQRSHAVEWQSKCREKVQCPHIVSVYNKHMGGVGVTDSPIGLYRIRTRSKKWYHRLFFHMLDMSTINAWLLYRMQSACMSGRSKTMPLHQFKARVALALCASNESHEPIKRGRPSATNGNKRKIPDGDNATFPPKKRATGSLPIEELRYDGLCHFP